MSSNCANANDRTPRPDTAFGCPCDYLGNRFVYVVISARLRGLSIGLNITPQVQCNFYCIYCEVPRPPTPTGDPLDLDAMFDEFKKTLQMAHSGELAQRAPFNNMPPELLTVRQVIISGDGEPTLATEFPATVQRLVHLRASAKSPYFKIVLFTNGSALGSRRVEEALRYFTSEDEVWIKLDAGTQVYMAKVNGPGAKLDVVLANIRALGAQRPVGIQSLFPMIHGEGPPEAEIDAYIERLQELKASGANVSMVQVFSSSGPARMTGCQYLSLKSLNRICRRIRSEVGLPAEVF